MTKNARLALLVAAIGQFLIPLLPRLGVGLSVGDRARAEGIPPELPPGIFFAIWGVIFLGYLATAVLANTRPTFASDRIALPLALAGFGNSLWMLGAQAFGSAWLDFLLLIPILIFAWLSAQCLTGTLGYDGRLRSILHAVTVGLLAGWLAVAVSISVPEILREVTGRGVSDAIWHSLWAALISAGLLSFIFTRYVSRTPWFFLALVWGLIGIIANNWVRLETHGLAIATAIFALYLIRRRLFLKSPEEA